MKILITGASGFIAQKVIKKYIEDIQDVEIIGLTRKEQKSENSNKIKYLKVDILDKYVLEEIFKKNSFDIVFHFAAITAHEQLVDNKFEAFNLNMSGTQNLLELFNRYCEGALFFYTSTGKVYGATNELPITECAVVNPTTILGKTKYITERVIDFYVNKKNKYIIARIFNIYGEGQKENFVLPTILNQLNKEKVYLGNIDDKRDYLYIDDLVEGIISCVKNREKFKQIDYVNIGSGEAVSVRALLKIIHEIIGREINVETISSKMRLDETSEEYCDNYKLSNLTGWHQKINLREGVYRVLKDKGII